MDKEIKLTLREAKLLQSGINVALGAYRSLVPSVAPGFGVDDELSKPSQVAASESATFVAMMMMVRQLEQFRDDFQRAGREAALQGPVAIRYSDENEAEEDDAHELTLTVDTTPSGQAQLLMLALFQGCLMADVGPDRSVMGLLERLIA